MKELFTVVYGVNGKILFIDIYGNEYLLSPCSIINNQPSTTYEIFIGNDDSVKNLPNKIGNVDIKELSDREIFFKIYSIVSQRKYIAEAKNKEAPKYKEVQVKAHTRRIAAW